MNFEFQIPSLFSGRSPADLTLVKVHADGYKPTDKLPNGHGHTVTVPGAAAAWVDTVDKFGSGKVNTSLIIQAFVSEASAHSSPAHLALRLSWHHLHLSPLDLKRQPRVLSR
jgi:gamma-glutamyltranspeptidase/glutathione hydrolase